LKNRKYIFVDTFPVNGHASPPLLFQGRACNKKDNTISGQKQPAGISTGDVCRPFLASFIDGLI
jgi:hypothetical protein